MNKPDFQAMNRADLQHYVLTHPDDREAFHAFVDRLHAEGNWVTMPPLQSPEDLDNYPEFLDRVIDRSRKKTL